MPPMPPYAFPPFRQVGKWAAVGDSIQSGFGGAIPWSTQAISYWRPDSVAVTNLGIAGQAVGIDIGAIPAMIKASQLALCDAVFDGAKNYNVASITSGLNDGAQGRTPGNCYTDLATWRTGRTAVGFKCIYICPVRLSGGAFYGTPAGQTWRSDLITLATANTGGFDAVVNVDAIAGTPGDGVNYDVDQIHLTTLGQKQMMLLVLSAYRPLVGLPP